jgi:fermentation-respiration switch protein FrsA (DUF1100 family)
MLAPLAVDGNSQNRILLPRMRFLRGRLVVNRFLFLVCCCVLLTPGCASSLQSFERNLVFQGRPYPSGDWTPDSNLFVDAYFDSQNGGEEYKGSPGTRLHGWYSEHPSPRAIVLMSHGNAGNVAGRRYLLPYFRDELGCSILIYDYRGYGRSEGEATEQGILEDGRAAQRWLAKHNNVRPDQITLVGGSLGGAIAVDLAAKEGARGLVLVSTFSSIPDVAQSHVWWAPIRSLMEVSLNSERKIGDYFGPLLQVHGDADRVVPYALGKKLHLAANEPKRLITVPGGGHNDAPNEEFTRALDAFLDELPSIEYLPEQAGEEIEMEPWDPAHYLSDDGSGTPHRPSKNRMEFSDSQPRKQ